MKSTNLLKSVVTKSLVLFLLIGLSLVSCKKSDEVSSFEEELQLLAEYLQANNITVQPTASGLYYIETEEGGGKQVEVGDSVTLDHTGKFLDGTVFSSGTFTYQAGSTNYIAGFNEGVLMMKNGGKATLILPSNLAYGAAGRDNIPGYATLIFEIEILSVL